MLAPILLADSWYISRQGYRYPYLLDMFRAQFLSGHLYPRWLPGLMGGYGYPTFFFYPPGFWFLSLPASLLVSAVTACKLTLILALTMGGMGVYRLACHLCSPRSAGFVAILFYLTPALTYALYSRGDLSELLAMLLCPWLLHYLLQLSTATAQARPCLRPLLCFALVLAATLYSHPMTFAWLCLTAAVLTLGLLVGHPHKYLLLIRLALAALLAATLTAPYWHPLLTLQSYSDISIGMTENTRVASSWKDLFLPSSPLLGPILPLLTLWGMWIGRHSPLIRATAILYIFYLWYLLPYAQPLRDALPLLHYLQWPSRVAMVMPLLQSLAIGRLLQHGETRFRCSRLHLALAICVMLACAAYNGNKLQPLDYPLYARTVSQRFDDMTHLHEFRPLHATTKDLRPLHYRSPYAFSNTRSRITFLTPFPARRWVFTFAPAVPATLTINQFYFPGWKILVDGAQAAECPVIPTPLSFCYGANGLITLAPLPPGPHRVQLSNEGAPHALERNILMALATCLLAALLRRLAAPAPSLPPLRRHLPLMLCALASLLFALPVLAAKDWYTSNQSYRYPYLLDMFRDQFLAGQWYPRWLPDLAGGYGYPTFYYYPPGYWFLNLPLALLLPSAVLVCKIMLVAMLAFGGLGIWKLARCFCSPWAAAFVTACFYLSPQLHYVTFYRGALAELYATLCLPWVFYFLWQMRQTTGSQLQHHALCLAFTLCAIIILHPIVTVWLAITCALSLPFFLLDMPAHRPRMRVLLPVLLLALSLSSSYWLPAITLTSQVYYERGIDVSITMQSSSLHELFSPQSPNLGFIQPLLATLGLLLARQRFTRALLACYLLYSLYMTPLSLPLREAVPALGFLQWPSRLLPVLIPVNAIGTALLLHHRHPGKPYWAALALALMVYGILPYHSIRSNLDYASFLTGHSRSFEDMTHKGEFMPRTANFTGLRPRPAPPHTPLAIAPFPLRILNNRAGTDIQLSASPDIAAELTINQFDFPGWRMARNTQPLPYCPPAPVPTGSYCHDSNGRLTVSLPAGDAQNIHAWHEAPDAALRIIASIITALASLACIHYMSSKTQRPKSPGETAT